MVVRVDGFYLDINAIYNYNAAIRDQNIDSFLLFNEKGDYEKISIIISFEKQGPGMSQKP
jgi:hypothetical protein